MNLISNTAFGGYATGDTFFGIEDFQLSKYGDRFTGDAADNLVDGYDGDDLLDGGEGSDTLNGGLGDDTITGSLDGDVLNGGGFTNYMSGRDLISYEDLDRSVNVDLIAGRADTGVIFGASDTLERAQQVQFNDGEENEIVDVDDDTAPRLSTFEDIRGSDFDDTLSGDDGNNVIEGLDGNDILNGGDGRDTLIGGEGADALTGGAEVDTAEYKQSDAAVTANLNLIGTGGHAQGDSYAGVENLVGSEFADTLIGDGENNRLDPYRNGTLLTENLIGNGGTDTAVLNVTSEFGDIDYTVNLGNSGDGQMRAIEGASNRQTVTMQSIEDLEVFTRGGDDIVVSTRGGDDLVVSGAGADALSLGTGSDYVFAGDDDDLVLRIDGLAEDFGVITGNGDAFNQTFYLDGGNGVDTLFIDISFDNNDQTLVGAVPDGTQSDQFHVTSTGSVFANFEIYGGLITGGGDDVVGQAGDVDNLFGTTAGADTIVVGFGFDTVDGGESSTFIDGTDIFFEDLDTLIVDYSSSDGRMFSGANNDGDDGSILLEVDEAIEDPDDIAGVEYLNIERLFATGTNQNDIITGVGGAFFGAGDIINALGGDDSVEARAGNDLVRGGEGSDSLEGGDGDDTIQGGSKGGDETEQDTMQGGFGADRFLVGDAFGLYYDKVGDVGTISDFSRTAGDKIVLTGSADDYVTQVQNFGSGAITLFFTKADDGTADRLFLQVFSFGGSVSLNTDVDYETLLPPIVIDPPVVIDPPIVIDPPVIVNPPFLAATLGDQAEARQESNAASDLLDALEVSVTSEASLAIALWRKGGLSDEDLMQVFADNSMARGGADFSSVQALISGDLEAMTSLETTTSLEAITSDTIMAGDVLPMANEIIGDAIAGFAQADLDIVYEGDVRASGTFTDAFGLEEGFVLSTGRVMDIPGINQIDGQAVIGPRPSSEIPLVFEAVGALDITGETTTLYRAKLPDLLDGISSLSFTDDADFAGGATGRFTAFDLDALFVSEELIESTAGLDRADVNAIERLDVIDYNVANFDFTAGTQRAGNFADDDMFGEVNGRVDVANANLSQTDWFNGVSATGGGLTFGEGGVLAFNMNTPVFSTDDAPKYLYLTEVGAAENLTGAIKVSDEPIGTQGDLSTDLGAPGLAGDTTRLSAEFTVDFGAEDGPDFNEFDFVDLFQLVLVTEELPERGGAEMPDVVSVKVNGFDVLVTEDGTAVTLNDLAWSPYGDYDESLTLNLISDGPLKDEIKGDAFTAAYQVRGPIVDGRNTIEIEVADKADAFLDTAVFVAPIEGGGGGTGGNRAPNAVADIAQLFEDQSATLNVITSGGVDTDPDGDALSITDFVMKDSDGNVLQTIAVGAGLVALNGGVGEAGITAAGDLTFNADGFFDDLDAGEVANVIFSYTISDGALEDQAQVTVTVYGKEGGGTGGGSFEFTSGDRFTTPENTTGDFAITASNSTSAEAPSYGVTGTDAALFEIDAATGVLSFKAAPDFEAPADEGGDNIYDVTVSASITGDVIEQQVQVTVTDVDEGGGGGEFTFTSGADFTTPENEAGSFAVTASNSTSAEAPTYAISGTDAALFAIDPNTGVLMFVAPPDFEAPGDDGADNVYDLTVEASITGQTISQNVAVTVTDVDEGDDGGGGGDKTIVEGTDGSDRLVGTDGDDCIASGAGAYDQMRGLEGKDCFFFGDETSNGIREQDAIVDFDADEDMIVMSDPSLVKAVVQRDNGVSIYLSGDRDAIYVLGENLTPDNVTIIQGDSCGEPIIGGGLEKIIVAGTDASERLFGTDADERIESGAGAYDQSIGGGGKDCFYFGAETSNGIKEQDAILDFDPLVDEVVLEDPSLVKAVVQRDNGVSIYLSGDQDAIYVLGDGVTVENTVIRGDDVA